MRTRHRFGFAVVVLTLLLTLGAAFAPAMTPVSAQEATPAASPMAGESVNLIGLVAMPGPITVADLQTLPTQSVEVDFQSGSGPQHHAYTGVLLWDVLD